MRIPTPGKPSPAMVVAMAALFVSLTGAGWAITAIPKNSIKSKQIKNGQVKSIDVADNGLSGTDIDESSLSLTPDAPAGPAGGDLTGSYPNPSVGSAIQRRVSGSCAPGEAIRQVAADGTVTCEASGGPPSGPAGGDLTGAYPDPTIAGNAVNSAKVANNSLSGDDVDESTLDATVVQQRVAQACATGSAIRTIAQNGTVTCEGSGGPPSGPAGGDLTGTYPNPAIAGNAVDSAKIADNSVTGNDVDESTLGTVPSATNANTLDTIDSTAFGRLGRNTANVTITQTAFGAAATILSTQVTPAALPGGHGFIEATANIGIFTPSSGCPCGYYGILYDATEGQFMSAYYSPVLGGNSDWLSMALTGASDLTSTATHTIQVRVFNNAGAGTGVGAFGNMNALFVPFNGAGGTGSL